MPFKSESYQEWVAIPRDMTTREEVELAISTGLRRIEDRMGWKSHEPIWSTLRIHTEEEEVAETMMSISGDNIIETTRPKTLGLYVEGVMPA